jgi:hypothetical protein
MYEPEKDENVWVDFTLDSDRGTSLVYQLKEDVNRKEQLGFWDENSDERTKTARHRESEQQLLEEGKLGRSEFSARLQKATFGIFKAN